MRLAPPRILLVGALLALTLCGAAHAEKDNRSREALRRAQQVISDLQDSNDGLTREKSELTVKLNDATAALEKAKKELADAEHHLSGVEHQVSSTTSQAKDLNDKLAASDKANQDLTAKLQQSEQSLQDLQKNTDAQHKEWDAKAADMTQQNQQCEEKNVALARVGLELMDRYKKKGVWDALRGEEPITGLKSVELQNLLQSYREQIDANRINPVAPSTNP